MTIATKCFEILARADRPMTSRELAKIIGNRQTRGSVESVLYKYVSSGCLKKVQYDSNTRCKTAWVFLKYPSSPQKWIPKSVTGKGNAYPMLVYMGKMKTPATAEELAKVIGFKGGNRQAKVHNTLDPYIHNGYVKKVPYRWGRYGKYGFVLVRMPKC